MKLKHDRINVFYIEDRDLNEFINDSFEFSDKTNIKFNYVETEEANNGSQELFKVKKRLLDEDDKAKLDEFKTTGYFPFGTSIILQHLCNEELIEEGNYLISVFW